jgi:valyl-tRNA synthetase
MKLNKVYQPGDYEPNIYALWEASGAFAPTGAKASRVGKGEPYSIAMPPPNANANLHVGHSLEIIKDIMIRYQRMLGKDAIYIPGADHAGFETWVVFEKRLEQQGKSRFDFSRDKLYKMTWDFVEENRDNMNLQMRALGVSCDWGKSVYTLDPEVIDVVYTTFKRLWDDGLVYRGERIVNYCTQHDTSFADIEVDYREEKGKLWYIDYLLATGKGSITVATTRPETMLGDEAVAVNPNDKRYAKLIGQKVILPLVNKEIPIIADAAIEHEFGTGAVKVTPAHDPIDFEIGQRHKLPITSVIGFDGRMVAPAPVKFVGMNVDEARAAVVMDLQAEGLISKIEDFTHQVPHCYKCGTVIQPLVKDQWFIKVQPLAKEAIKAVKAGKIKFTPKAKADELIRYYKELKDWNISRQIPWGIPIPAFRRAGAGELSEEWIFDTRVDQKEIEVDGVKYIRDEDTFDTWFSSGQWPYIVTRGDLTRFYPTTLMECGVDIMRPWVSRMIMLGLYILGEIPFRSVYLHGMVTDERNQKMSKSKGNVVNPMDFVEKYGSDALRMGIIANRSAGQPQAFSTATVIAGRNFCNKLWNIARFVSDKTQQTAVDSSQQTENAIKTTGEGDSLLDSHYSTLFDHWILRQLDTAREQIEKLLDEYRFAEAYEVMYHVVWDDVADWYIEASKINDVTASAAKQSSETDNGSGLPRATGDARNDNLYFVLKYILKLAHPFAPFVSETIWQSLYSDDKTTTLLIAQQWPKKLEYNKLAAAEFDKIRELVSEIRYLSAELGGKKRTLMYANDDLISSNEEIIKHLARLKSIEQTDQAQGLRVSAENREAWLSATKAELAERYEILENRLAAARLEILNLKKRLTNKKYVANAPAELVRESREELADKQALAKRLETELKLSK